MPASGNSLRFNISIPPGSPGSKSVPVSDRTVSATTVEDKTLAKRHSSPKSLTPSKTPDEQIKAELLAILGKPYESNCASCNGRGVIGVSQCGVCNGQGLVKTRLI